MAENEILESFIFKIFDEHHCQFYMDDYMKCLILQF